MSRSPYALNSYTGGATYATIVATGIGAADTTITITGTNASWSPLGTAGGWYLALDYGTSAEEKIFVPSGSWTYSNTGVSLVGVTRGIDGTTGVIHPAGSFVAPVITSIDTFEANELVSQNLGNFIVRSATATCTPGEWTVFSGTTAAQTLSLPSGVINQTDNQISNYSTVGLTIASGSNAKLNNYGVLGNVIIPPNASYTFTYEPTNTTWYTTGTNTPTAYVGSGLAGQHLTPSGAIAGQLSWAMPTSYDMPATYLSPYNAWNLDPGVNIGSAAVLVTGTLYYNAIWIPTAMTLSGISFYPTTFAATDTAYIGFFNSTTQLAVCSGIIGGTTNALVKTLISGGTYNISSPGLYYIGIVISGSSATSFGGNVLTIPSLYNLGVGNQTNSVTGLRLGTVVIGNRALYANNATISGIIQSAPSPGPVLFFALS
jgi:hypothetical protein